MVGVAFNPNNCAFLSNQAFNANQFDTDVPNAGNTTVHTVLWDFIAGKIYWVDAKTNLIQYEIPSVNAGNLFVDIAYVGFSESGLEYIANPSGGTGPYTYEWSIESSPTTDYDIPFPVPVPVPPQNVFVTPVGIRSGALSHIRCKVTDSEGRISSGYHLIYSNLLL